MLQSYRNAVQLAHETGPNDLEREKEIATIYATQERVVFTDHQLKISRKKLSKIMSWKERLAYHEELKGQNEEAATNFFTQVIQTKRDETPKKSGKRLQRVSSAVNMAKTSSIRIRRPKTSKGGRRTSIVTQNR